MILRCRLCHAAIAAFDPARLTPPLTSAVFEPLAPGFPPPRRTLPGTKRAVRTAAIIPRATIRPSRESLATDVGELPLSRPHPTAAKRAAAKRGN